MAYVITWDIQDGVCRPHHSTDSSNQIMMVSLQNKGNNKITELRTILQRESQNS